MQVTVYYEDTDATGIVYHPNYLKYCDRARVEHFFETGTPLQEKDAHLIIHSLNCRYLAPAKLGDVLNIKSVITKLKRTSFELEQTIYLNNIAIFTMQLTMLYVQNMRPTTIPASMLELFHSITKDKI